MTLEQPITPTIIKKKTINVGLNQIETLDLLRYIFNRTLIDARFNSLHSESKTMKKK